MSARKTEAATTESAPIKRLVLRRERVKDLNVNSGVKTGAQLNFRPPASSGVTINSNYSVNPSDIQQP